jgi:hypothetical protein
MISTVRRKKSLLQSLIWASKPLIVLLLMLVYNITSLGQAFVQQGNKLAGTDAVPPSFQGRSVAISADGNTAIVGGLGDDGFKGAAWVFIRNQGIWEQQGQKLVGTGAIGNSIQGRSVDISDDGNTAIVGGYADNGDMGSAWIYKRVNGIWSQDGEKLVGTGSSLRSYQGYSVSISGDGNTCFIGGWLDVNPQGGASWVFVKRNGVWVQQGNKLVGVGSFLGNAGQGYSVSMSYDGNTAVIGGYNEDYARGAAWVFKRSGDTWTQQGNKLTASSMVGIARLGWSVAISSDGKIVILGGPSDNGGQISGSLNGLGAAWIYTQSNNNEWVQQGTKLIGTNYIGNPGQGVAVSLSSDGNIAIIGGDGDNSQRGAAWVFKRTAAGNWQQLGDKISGLPTTPSSYFGFSVAMSGDGKTAIVGSPQDNNSIGVSSIFVYQPTIRINDVSITEDAGTAQLQVCLSEPSDQPVTVQYARSHGIAKADSDYVAVPPGTLTIPAGQTCATIPVTIINDTITEGNEDAVFRIFNATNAIVGDAYGAINIRSNDAPPPTISPVDYAFAEQDAVVEIPLCVGEFDKPITVTYRIRGLTATPGLDYIDTVATITKQPGTGPCLYAKVRLLTDNLDNEDREQFEVIISNPINARIVDSVALVEIINIPSPVAAVSISDAMVNENAGTATLFVNLSKPIAAPVTVNYSTANVTAIAGTDYFQNTNFNVTIPAGQTSTTISLSLIDDVAPEPTESFNVVINSISVASNLRVNLEDRYGAVNILDNDVIGTQPSVRITNSKNVKEGTTNSVVLDICLSSPSSETVTVEYVTSNATATAGTDYAYTQNFVRIYPGATCTTISIPINDDQLIEDNEYFTVRLVNPANATISFSNIAYVYIEDNDNLPCTTGSICYRGFCSVNLNNAYSLYQLPPNTEVSWHTGTPATNANRLNEAQEQSVSVSGTYYAAIYSSTTNCYTPTLPAVINVVSCSTTGPANQTTAGAPEVAKSEKTIIPATSIAPNPFSNGFNVAIHSDKATEAVVTLTDIYGRQVQTQKTMLNIGKNNIAVNPATKIPPGNYFLKVKTGEQVDVHKLVKQ